MHQQNLTGLILLLLLFSSAAMSQQPYICGIAEGYPPYQFQDSSGKVTGFDADVTRLVFEELDLELTFFQAPWNNVVASFYYSNRLDFVTGMEINKKRQGLFDFTRPYYYRKNALFVRTEDTQIDSINDLIGKVITGDRDSALESFLEDIGIKGKIRLLQTPSKEQSFSLLKDQQVSAVIAPRAVGLHIAEKTGLKVKILTEAGEKSPVGLAFKKNNRELLSRVDSILEKLKDDGKLDSLYKRWYINTYQEK